MDQIKQALVVDDTEDFRILAAALLRMGGFKVAVVCNGAEALDYLHKNPAPSVIVLDLRMPVMDGVEFLEKQLADPELAGIPVVIYTNESTRSPVLLGPTVAACVSKGSGGRVLIETVRLALRH